MKKFLTGIIVLVAVLAAGFFYWSQQPIIKAGSDTIPFTVTAGSGVRGAAQEVAKSGVPVQPHLLEALARISGKASRIKAGSYELEAGMSPQRLIEQLVRGEFAQHSLVVIEGWTFRQMRQAIAENAALKHDTVNLTDAELLAKISTDYQQPEGLFFPDTYLFAKGASDLQIYKRAHALMQKKLEEGWANRAPDLPYKAPYEALVMASIVEKETGQKADRDLIAGVFVNRLRKGMLLQTDPTVIYGMGERYRGNIRKRDLQTDTPYNTYTRPGLPPTPIALPGAAALAAALNPARTDALYFVARGDGTSHFSGSLNEHNQAVNKYQR
ncbi:MAG: aminodeoxychorismate lyase protein [Burkholderia sp.]|nr:aminodeoxychorismate lyase protein [Burkholderia sp.]